MPSVKKKSPEQKKADRDARREREKQKKGKVKTFLDEDYTKQVKNACEKISVSLNNRAGTIKKILISTSSKEVRSFMNSTAMKRGPKNTIENLFIGYENQICKTTS